MITPRGPTILEDSGFINIHRDIEVDGCGHFQEKIGKKGARRAATNDRDARTVPQSEIILFVFDKMRKRVCYGLLARETHNLPSSVSDVLIV